MFQTLVLPFGQAFLGVPGPPQQSQPPFFWSHRDPSMHIIMSFTPESGHKSAAKKVLDFYYISTLWSSKE